MFYFQKPAVMQILIRFLLGQPVVVHLYSSCFHYC